MQYNGATAISFTHEGALKLGCFNGFVKEGQPFSFTQENNMAISCHVEADEFNTRFDVEKL
jgi:hypothetical protein